MLLLYELWLLWRQKHANAHNTNLWLRGPFANHKQLHLYLKTALLHLCLHYLEQRRVILDSQATDFENFTGGNSHLISL